MGMMVTVMVVLMMPLTTMTIDHGPLKIMEDAMRKDLVLVPTSLLPGD